MSGNTRGGRRIPREVHQVREALLREFDGLINVDDITHPDPVERQRAFLSRALAAKAARRLTDCTPEEAAATIIDGEHDFGIDAVAFSAAATEMWLIQAKWSDKGTAGFNTEAANKLVRGLKKLDNRDFDQFNERFQRLADRVQSVLNSHTCKVVLVVAVMGDGRLSTETVDILDEARQDFEGFGRTIEHQVMSSAEFHQAVREDIAPQPISLSATMATGWHHRDTPYKAYYGLVAADELARWYGEKGDALYDRNVRTSLGLTSVNQVLVESLTKDPQNFWYLHNGITVICGSITEHFFAKRAVGEPVRLELTDASVVNGAQTVTSAHRAFEQNPEAVADAYVTVRIISVKDSPEGFDRDITEATNTQNHMERRDFIAIDEVQSRIREDFKLSLDKEYVFRRGELDPPPSAGCSVLEAATALACAHTDPALAVRVKGSSESLWERGSRGAYTRLFGRQPSAYQIWRSVQLMRRVREALHEVRAALTGRAASIADASSFLVSHIVFQRIGTEGIDEPDSSWEAALGQVEDRVAEVLAQLIPLVDHLFGENSYISSTFASEPRCRQLVNGVLDALSSGTDARDLAAYQQRPATRPQRRPRTIPLLVDHGHIDDGTRLVYRPSQVEEQAIGDWLNADPRRFFATWINDRNKPLLWEADGRRYSPTGLVQQIWRSAEWREAWSAVQGPKQWALPDGGTLVDLAERIWQEMLAAEETEGEPA
ncbi:AIPR family protein [Streptomyces asiaticus]|uniref:AIPR family protein n=1 Tax=Streptomyces asiaticus TaxID=114695 RepID=UPI003D71B9C5